MQHLNLFNFNIAGTLLLIIVFAVEILLIFLNKPSKDVVHDIGTNFILGISVLATGFFMKSVEFAALSLTYSFALFKPVMSFWFWLFAIFASDFVHYIYHWLGHKTQLFWAAHVTHHSSEQFNMSTGWRTSFLQLFYRFLFWAPLSFFGIPPEVVLLIESITNIWNFLVHTEKVGKLGVLDWWFNTPSNHRVHHGTNKQYIDKNMGGIFMVYDHLFGTYAKETEPVIYGITHNINTHNPVKVVFHEFNSIIKEVPKRKGIAAKAKYLFSPPN